MAPHSNDMLFRTGGESMELMTDEWLYSRLLASLLAVRETSNIEHRDMINVGIFIDFIVFIRSVWQLQQYVI